MGFWTLLEVASMPIIQVLIISILGAFMATDYLNLFPDDARKSLNKLVFMVFTPSLMFASLAKTVTLDDIMSWWFMPVNIGMTFLFGGILGWLAVKLVKPRPHLEGLVIATCSSGNLGNLLLIIVPAICKEDGSPFGDHNTCSTIGLPYASFSMALGGFYIWTYTYQLIKNSALKYKAEKAARIETLTEPNKNLDSDEKSHLLEANAQEHVVVSVDSSQSTEDDVNNQNIVSQGSSFSFKSKERNASFWTKLFGILYQILEELMAPPTLAAIIGFIFGAIEWLKNLIIGDNAPLHVIQDSITLLGNGTIPCITLILGGNLIQGLRKARLKPTVIISVICVRYILLPAIGIVVVKAASQVGFLPSDPLYHFVLMIQYTLPPAMNIGTMTQLFDVAQEECSVLFLWTYLVAVLSLTVWSTVFMWILT
ncbi:hypothetical protein ACH5RR_013529 [Cinchona calisaya]|uniref:Auxin efflux carrier family protein n=1 Tax=Cinchona calisaya TaxID=153742 RepID=A0ABD3A2Y7_9GENT